MSKNVHQSRIKESYVHEWHFDVMVSMNPKVYTTVIASQGFLAGIITHQRNYDKVSARVMI